ncbi:MAG: hypothetical protein ACOYJ2_09285 [Rickettsiales bacterium]
MPGERHNYSTPEIETSSLGNMLLILGGAKTRFVGLNVNVYKDELVYITRKEDGLKIPVIVDSVDRNQSLNNLTKEQWHAAGHSSGLGYIARLQAAGSSMMHGTLSKEDTREAQAVAQESLNQMRADSFTFHVATAQELKELGLSHRDLSSAFDGAQKVIAAYDEGVRANQQPAAVEDALKFANDSLNTTADTLRENAGRAVAALRPQRGGPGQHGF